MNSKWIVALVGASLLLMACGKKTTLTPEATDSGTTSTARAQWVKNIPLKSSLVSALASSYSLYYGLCAQLVVPATGKHAGQRIIEVSSGSCPSGLVDNTTKKVFAFTFEAVGSSNQYALRDAEYGMQAGTAEWSSIADKTNKNVTQLTTLCTGTSDYCWMQTDMEGSLIRIDVY